MSISKNKYCLSFLLGSLSSLAFAPTYFFIFAIISFSGFLLLLDQIRGNKEAFLASYLFGLGQFIFSFYWISISLFVDIEKYFWLLPFALIAIPAAMALYIGFTGLATNYLANNLAFGKWQKILLFTINWLFFEFLRSHLFTGFPWNAIGYSLGFSNNLLQIASLVGLTGLGLLAIMFYGCWFLLFRFENNHLKFSYTKSDWILFCFIIFIFTASYIYGHYRLKVARLDSLVTDTKIRLVQPNIEQTDDRSQESFYEAIVENVKLSTSKSLEGISYVIWPESGVPFVIDKNSLLLKQVAKAAPAKGFLITGAMRAEFKDELPFKVISKIWNSIFVINQDAKIIESYDKNHLVPFGEYVPFEKYLPFISKITDGGGIGFSIGDGLKTIKPSKILPSFSPLICYEAIFPDQIINQKSPPQFLLNLTNDAWFGNSSGPYQHFAMVKLRAIEYGLPLVRVANTGISALVDPYGRVVAKIDLGQRDFLDVNLMKNLDGTIYKSFGNSLLIATILLILLALILPIIFRDKKFIKYNQLNKKA